MSRDLSKRIIVPISIRKNKGIKNDKKFVYF